MPVMRRPMKVQSGWLKGRWVKVYRPLTNAPPPARQRVLWGGGVRGLAFVEALEAKPRVWLFPWRLGAQFHDRVTYQIYLCEVPDYPDCIHLL